MNGFASSFGRPTVVFLGALAAFAATACDSSSDGSGGAATTTATAATQATGNGASASTKGAGPTGATSGNGTSGTGGAPPEMRDVHVVARVSQDGAQQVFSWPGSSIRTVVDGDGVDFVFDGADGIYFQVAIDGAPTEVVESQGGTSTFEISGLGSGQHEIELVRRNEGFFGDIGFVSATARAGASLVPSPVRARRIELIGDSLTAGYGIEGDSATCNFSGATESAYSTYGMTAARAVGADAHVVAWSGKGMARNCCGDGSELMPELWVRTLAPSAEPEWDFASWLPDAVVINLGTNDFNGGVENEDYVTAYVTFLEEVRAVYPDAHVFCVTWTNWGNEHQELVSTAIAMSGLDQVTRVDFEILGEEGLGCDYHTNTVTNARLGAELAATFADVLGW